MRFGAENRLFVIMVNRNDMDESWEMKRQFEIIEPKVKNYLDNFNENTLKEVNFTFGGREYKSLSDVLFIIN